MTRPIRVRFAPSPTGTLHVGNARTALFNYLYARRYGGTLVLRIEDTDQERSTDVSESTILEDLTWLGVQWDEGPDVGGAYGPYRQSERLDIYNLYLEEMLASGHAYRCFCSRDELEKVRVEQTARKEPPHYPGTCRNHSSTDSEARAAAGEDYVIRYKISQPVLYFEDGVRGGITKKTDSLGGDFVIRKADGFPTYNYAVVVDDHLMEISHILRGEDHLTNTAKQFLIYDSFGWERPKTFHMSIILGPDKAKLSKRHGSTSVAEFRELGYLPSAVANQLGLLGWNSGTDQELYNSAELIAAFSSDRLIKSSAIFDYKKLLWINGQHMRRLAKDEFVKVAVARLRQIDALPDFWPEADWSARIGFLQDSIETLDGLAEFWPIFASDEVLFEHKDAQKILRMEEAPAVIRTLAGLVGDSGPLLPFDTLVEKIAASTGAAGRKLYQPLRMALTGRPHGPDIHTLSAWIPVERVRSRIRQLQDKEPWQS